MKRFTALLLTLALAFGAFSIAAAAESGTWGKLTWELSADGTLTVAGFGMMDNRKHNSEDAWRDYSEKVKSLVISDGITSVGDDTFYYFTELESVSLPDSVDTIGVSAFAGCRKLKTVNLPAGLFYLHAASFSGCALIESITVPEKVNYIGASVFYDCDSLALVYIKSPDVADMLVSHGAAGELLNHAKTVIFSDGIEVTDYVKEEYPVTGTAAVGGEKVNWYKKSAECAVHYYEDDVCAICGHVRGEEEPSVEPPADDPSSGDTSSGDTSTDDTSADDMSIGDTSVDTSTDNPSSGDTSTDNPSTGDTSVDTSTDSPSSGDTSTDNPSEEHTHSFDGWKSDEAAHWHECSACGEKADEADHVYDGDLDPDCNICGYVREASALLGDANGDGNVNNIDASLVLQYDAGVASLDSAALAAADVNADALVNNIDASRILQLDAGVISEF